MPLPVISTKPVPNGLSSRIRKSDQIVRYNDERECFVNLETKKRYKGVTTTARRVFYQDYVYRHASVAPTSTRAPPSKGIKGIQRGNRVDRELSEWANGTTGGVKSHAYSEKVASAMSKLGLVPIAGQVPVFDDDIMIATAVDMVCYSKKTRGTVLCEIKCGWNGAGAYKQASGRMHSAMHGFDNSPANQHQIQLAMTHYLFGVTFGTNLHESYVVRVADKGVYFYKLEDPVMKRIGRVCLAMSESKTKRRRPVAAIKKKRKNKTPATSTRKKRVKR